MRRNQWLALVVLSGLAAIPGVYFGLPAYAEWRVRALLDERIATLADPGTAGYSGIRVDVWNDRLDIAELHWPIAAGTIPGLAQPVVASVTGVVIDRYDRAAASRALGIGGPDGQSEVLAGRIDWAGARLIAPDGEGTYATVQAGHVVRPALDHINPDGLPAGLAFDGMDIGPVTLAIPGGLRCALTALAVRDFGPDGIGSVALGTILASGGVAADDGSVAASMEGSLGGLAAERITLGDVVRIGSASAADLAFKVTDTAGTPFLAMRVGQYTLADVRQDPEILDLYDDLRVVLVKAPADAPPAPDVIARYVEALVRMLERAETLGTGADVMRMERVEFGVAGLAEYRFGAVEIRDARGLRPGRAEILSQVVKDSLGTESRTAVQTLEGMDLRGLPAWIRTMAGGQITAASLDGLRDRLSTMPLREIVPAVDFGTMTSEGVTVARNGKPLLDLARLSQDRLRGTANGDLELGYSFEGLKLDLATLRDLPGQHGATGQFDTLMALGIDRLDIDFGFTARIGLASNNSAASFNLAEPSFASLSIEAEVAEFDIEALRDTARDERTALALQSELTHARIVVSDLGGRRIMLERGAASQPGATPESYGQVVAGLARSTGQRFGSEQTLALAEAVAAFVETGGTLAFVTDMETPARILELLGLGEASPAAAVQRLGLKAEITAPQ